MMTNRDDLLELWDGSQTSGPGCASWLGAMDGLTAAAAAWKSAPGRHSIGQNVNHVRYWRLFAIDRAYGRPRPDDTEIRRQNFADPQTPDEAAWQACVAALHESHATLHAAVEDESADFLQFKGIIAHDHYHLGQIMLLRTMQGKPPVE